MWYLASMQSKATSTAVQDYLKSIYLLESRSDAPVSTSDLASRLGVRDASASGMLAHLSQQGLVEHVPYHGVRLTREGRRLALAVVRRHRLLESFMVEKLGMGWEEVHEEAEALEHSVSERLLGLIAEKLGNPATDPHGDPIPSAALDIVEPHTERLDRLPVGARGRLVRILDAQPALLSYLSAAGIALGDEVEVLAAEPFGGSLAVRFAGVVHRLGRLAAEALGIEVSR